MDAHKYEAVAAALLKEASGIATAKRPGYTMLNKDVLANFKNVANRLGMSPTQALGVYFLKHIDAITTFLKNPEAPQAEAIIGRFADAINYLQLGFALCVDEKLVDDPTAFENQGKPKAKEA